MGFRKILFLPLAWMYGLVMALRNMMFAMGIFHSKKHPVAIIAVGNLSMGGTGKTPHVEYLIEKLKNKYPIATLSRGYGRKTKGFLLANENADASTLGDEPLQYFHKFKNITVAVDEKRNRGVSKLIEQVKGLKIVILDDAYQHRWIERDINILLTDYHNPYNTDYVVPSGTLREFRAGASRADIIIVTKTPTVLSPIVRRKYYEDLKVQPYQKLLFSKIEYDGFVEIATQKKHKTIPTVNTIVLFTGIANSYPLQEFLQKFCSELVVLSFPDHHQFNDRDMTSIKKTFDDLFTKNKMLITTEKDYQRIMMNPKKELLLEFPFYYVPIHVTFHHQDAQELDNSLKNLFF